MKNVFSNLPIGKKIGFLVGILLILAMTGVLAYWTLREVLVPVASNLLPEQASSASQALDAAKVHHELSNDGATLSVAERDLGRARIALSASGGAAAPTPGLELFNSTDFAATEFSQRVNFQRALQGELSRTIQAMDGIRAARVHIVLPESGAFRKRTTRPSAAVALALTPGHILSVAQIAGIRRLVAAAVPDIKLDEVTLVDFSGRALTDAGSGDDSTANAAQLDLKRNADSYFEGKLQRLLSETLSRQTFAIAVDTSLNFDQLKVTTDQPIASRSPADAEKETGVVVREKQSVRSVGSKNGDGQNEAEVTDSDYEYVVGRRLEESLRTPGGIRRLSVSVVIHGGATTPSQGDLERLVGNAVGADSSRGDQIAVTVIPDEVRPLAPEPQIGSQASNGVAVPPSKLQEATLLGSRHWLYGLIAAVLIACASLGALMTKLLAGRRPSSPAKLSDVEMAALTRQIRAWLDDDGLNVQRQ